jgi:hypothetical protein
MNAKTRNIIGWVLTALLSAAFLLSAAMKLSGNPEAVNSAAHFGLSIKKFTFIGIVEIVSTVLFIYPRTGLLGTLLLAAYLGGAIATHLEHFLSPNGPVIFQCVLWITAVIRFPELSARLMGRKQGI